MIKEYKPIVQALLGTCFTWAVTAAGALMVIFFRGTQPRLLDTSLGFAAGVMTAASYWSLLGPAIEMAKESNVYGAKGQYAFIPACLGFLLGASFTFAADVLISKMGIESPNLLLVSDISVEGGTGTITRRRVTTQSRHRHPTLPQVDLRLQWKRILLLIIAITVHNIPEGLAVGVGFGAIGTSSSASFYKARNLAIGIGIQNFPEGLAVSLPLKAAGFSTMTAFWYGQLSGMVEPIFGLIGALLVTAAEPLLPYALAFAAGAMIYVVVDDIIPEANTKGNGSLASWGAICGFMVMMVLEVALQ
ncbi:zinc transporter ZIP11 isoform X2 [Halyomorpha halys]|uniref:zinc transporter ZIP11 isoform X2 n=1 Tax=Halyomorpha halys TaxID=286706 RepID=UPI0006D4F53E|nr:zinc transporter ZIP11 isoform X2 [Halyomorpha halys]